MFSCFVRSEGYEGNIYVQIKDGTGNALTKKGTIPDAEKEWQRLRVTVSGISSGYGRLCIAFDGEGGLDMDVVEFYCADHWGATDPKWHHGRFRRDLIETLQALHPAFLRFPGGSNTAKRLGDGVFGELKKLGYGWIDWNIATGDGVAMMTPDEYRDNVLNHTNNRKVLVVLMHDYSGNTLAALPEIIDGLRSQGYTLLPLFYESEMVNKPE